jgi:60 kDa SS-A/Ro ribonucleoprotein
MANSFIFGFAHTFKNLGITAKDTLEGACRKVRENNFGSTDCALPMKYALQHKIPVDVFTVYTDSEINTGDKHPSQALAAYRKAMGIQAKLVVVGMTATDVSIADPNDAGMMDVVGFDGATPELISDFARN